MLIAIGCKKYEDGPLISLRTKKQRLCRSWIMNEVLKDKRKLNVGDTIEKDSIHCLIYKSNNNIYTFFENGFYLEVSPETYYKYVDFQLHEGEIAISLTLHPWQESWWFDSNKNNLYTRYWDNRDVNNCKILRLTKEELWTSQIKNSYELEFHYFSIKDKDFKRFDP